MLHQEKRFDGRDFLVILTIHIEKTRQLIKIRSKNQIFCWNDKPHKEFQKPVSEHNRLKAKQLVPYITN
jgi:hypothetical protein